MSAASARGPEIVGRSSAGPRTLRIARPAASRDAAYRRLATTILRLDVPSLNQELRAGRERLRLSRAA